MNSRAHKSLLEKENDLEYFRTAAENYISLLLDADLKNDINKGLASQNIPVAEKSIKSSEKYPVWAMEPFQIARFQSGELRLALPLKDIFEIVDINIAWLQSAAPEIPDWCLGFLSRNGEKVPVVDPYSMILPAPYRSTRIAAPGLRITKVIIVEEGKLGVAVDSMQHVSTLNAQDAAWRSHVNTSRPWLLATVRAEQCAIVDAKALVDLIARHQIVV